MNKICTPIDCWEVSALKVIKNDIGLGRGNINLITWLAQNERKNKADKEALSSLRGIAVSSKTSYKTTSDTITCLIYNKLMVKKEGEKKYEITGVKK